MLLPLAQILEGGTAFIPQINLWVFCLIFYKIGYNIKPDPELNVQNLVASGELGITLNLNKIAMRLRNIEYEPEQFPGLVYKIEEPKASFLLFSNGKIVCTGTNSEKELNQAVSKLVENLNKIKIR